MRVAFDATAMPARRAGAGVYTEQLARALATHAHEHPLLLLDRHGAFADLAGRPGVTVQRVVVGGRLHRMAWEQTALPALARSWGADVLHGPHHSLPLRRAARAAVVTVHDVTFDLLPRRYTVARRWYMRAITRLGLLRAARVIVPSAFVRRELVRRYLVDPARVHVVPEAAPAWLARVEDGARLEAVRARYRLPRRFLLSVGTLEPGKNRGVLLDALDRVRARGVDVPLVVVGQRGWLDAGIRERPDVRALGYVADADLAALYSLATVFVFPSLLEGFGLPPLEAIACGTPVVAARRPAMPEVLGDAVLYAPPHDAAAWAGAIERLLGDAGLRAALVERGRARAARYSWERAARETLAVYRLALHDAGANPAALGILTR